MSLVGHLDLGRSDRVPVDRVGTLRDLAKTPIDVVVDNLSATGCLFVLDSELPLGALVSIGIPGIGIRHARISRIDRPYYACAFLAPVSSTDIVAALSVDTLVEGAFPAMREPVPVQGPPAAVAPAPIADDEPATRLPVGTRFAVIVGVSAILWTAIVGGAIAVTR